jgi:sugar phosphate isomerase/epimerase
MALTDYTFSVFTKPWKTLPIPELADLVRSMGFTGIELPVRPGYQVEPETAGKLLPVAAKQMAAAGVKICSVAGNTDAATILACAEAGVPVIRTMARIPDGMNYLEAEAAFQREYDGLVPLLDKHHVTIGVQNHFGKFVPNAHALRQLIGKYEARHVAAVWDAAHEALCGTLPEYALDVLWSHLCMVNLKNAFPRRTNGPEAEVASWEYYWTSGRHGLASWPTVANELKKRGYRGVICLTAEYHMGDAERLARADMAFARSLFG